MIGLALVLLSTPTMAVVGYGLGRLIGRRMGDRGEGRA